MLSDLHACHPASTPAAPLAARPALPPGLAPEQPLSFQVEGDTLVGLLHLPQGSGEPNPTGVVIVVGGPQYRAGSHRQFVHLARHLAAAGHPVLRFDVRGMGDSTGAQRSFEQLTPDIGGAIDALLRHQPQVQRVVLWGLCDGASAALLYLDETADTRVAGLALANPWVRSEATLARTQVKHYYRQRLMQRAFWLKLLRGQVAGAALKGLWRNLRTARTPPASPAPAAHTAPAARNAPGLPFPERMARAWRRFPHPILLLLSGKDYTAREFEEAARSSAAWQGLLEAPRVQRADLPGVDHTFSAAAARERVAQACAAWLRALAPPACSRPLTYAHTAPAGHPAPPCPNALAARAEAPAARWLYRLHRVLERLSGGRAGLHVHLVCVQPIGQGTAPALRPDPAAQVRQVAPGDPLLAEGPRAAAVYAQRFAAGAACWVLTQKDRFAGHLWLQGQAFEEDVVRCRYVLPGPECVWDFDVYVPPELRGGRALARLWQGAETALAERGVRWSYSRISLFNPASARAHERLGARHVCTVAFLVLGPLQLMLGAHGAQLSTARSDAPSVRLRAPGVGA